MEIGQLPLSFILAASGTLSGGCSCIVNPLLGERFEINSDFTVLRLVKDRFNNSHLFVRRELGPELEMAVVEMSLEQQVETTSSSIQD